MNGVYIGSNRMLIKAAYGGKLIAPADDLSITPELVMHGSMEWPLTKYLHDHVQPGQTVVDVGANIGYFSVLLSHLVGPSGRVYAYEAHPDMHRYLEHNLSLNTMHDRALTFPYAVYSRDELIHFQASYRYMGNSSLQQHNEEYHHHYRDDIKTVSVQGVALDTHLKQLGVDKVDFLKIDIEGGEYHAFAGMETIIREQVKVVVFELNRMMLQHDEPKFHALLRRYAMEYGKQFFLIDPNGQPVPTALESILEHGSIPNVIMQ
ncbi:FkbM family methyltransferase [Paenibacillus sp. 481]|uniref:FkbM family methyltransferase n=1 Tax=Paenibacillus sp. 481 TaxID=2835869 RepID=UPI001E61667B|nr:FkbM family methyltransferase [Paenibacillus sp. 481]UHA75622.1 FkbM family methyltransferase [Paenibacillus sp. 481]